MDHENRMQRDADFARWYTLHYDRIRALCSRILRDSAGAEDIAQETLLRAWERRDTIREQDVGAWLSVVARNLCISSIRRGWRMVPTDRLPDSIDESADPAIAITRKETRQNVRRALTGVGRRHGRVLYLREVQGIDYGDLGMEMGLSAEGVRSIAFRARAVLRQRLKAVGEGFSGIVVGARYRVRSVRSRLRTATIAGEPGVAPAIQSTLNALLALGVAFASSAGGAYTAVARARPEVLSVAFAPGAESLRAPQGESDGRANDPSNGSVAGGPVGKRGSRGGGLIPDADVKAFDVEDKRSEITLYVAGQSVTVFFNGMDGDGLDPAYRAIDVVFGPLCAEAPEVCRVLSGDFEK